jgi:Bromodomain
LFVSLAVQASLFECESCPYIVPHCLYEQRLRHLESALTSSGSESVVETFRSSTSKSEEDDWLPSDRGKIQRLRIDDVDVGHPSLNGSGFGTLEIVLDEKPKIVVSASPWEVSVPSLVHLADCLIPPKLTGEEKQKVRDALASIRNMDHVEKLFLHPVGYKGHISLVEVPYDLTLVTKRLEADYYCSVFSAASDVRYIYSNCCKCNGEDDVAACLAYGMMLQFETQVLDGLERTLFHKFNAPIADIQASDWVALKSKVKTETVLTPLRPPLSRKRSAEEEKMDHLKRRIPYLEEIIDLLSDASDDETNQRETQEQ